MNKKEMSLDYDKIREKLVGMGHIASERMSAGVHWFEVDGKKRYVRIISKSFRAVSLDAVNPCGSLLTAEKKKVNAKILKSALVDAGNSNLKNHEPGKTKSEQRIQAFVIWQALTDPQGLPNVLDIADRVDALWFVTDELSLPPIRADIIMLGERDGLYFPVFVELKNKRSTEVGKQVRTASEIAGKVAQEFCQFLSSATGKPIKGIHMAKSMGLVIWGDTKRERPEAQEMRDKHDVLTVCHLEQGEEGEKGYGVFKFRLDV